VRPRRHSTYGDTIHSLSRTRLRGPFLPGYVERRADLADAGLLRIDHMVGNVELGRMNHWADWYSRVLGFSRYISFDDKDISTEYSALMSVVMSDDSFAIKFPINGRGGADRRSTILDYYRGRGCAHRPADERHRAPVTVCANGIEFLSVPDSYYIAADAGWRIDRLRRSSAWDPGDRDEEGYLLQLFTRPVVDRPTLFYEIIQRKGSRGFGKGNFRALFEAIEREQALRGNL
jgi:4-hydroxyphenylpyruvate dioxygenase